MVDLPISPSNRWCHVEYDRRPSPARLRRDILGRRGLVAASRAAHSERLELFAIIKTFDLAYNCFVVPDDGRSAVPEIERRFSSVIPEIAAHQEWTMQSNPAWRAEPSFPTTRLRFYSEQPLPRLAASDIAIRISSDNQRYRPHSARFTLRQGSIDRPNQRWTPAGNADAPGTRRNWFIELDGLNLRHPFAAIEIGKPNLTLHHRGFMLAEAFTAAGQPAPFTLATRGDTSTGLRFWKEWQGWNNVNEPILIPRAWSGRCLGLAFEQSPHMPALVEPAFAGTRRIWLERIRRTIAAGADGVDIRTLCHHNGATVAYLLYAFAQPVRETFASLYGRPPRCEPDDYQRIRRIRGDFYTQFLREAKKLLAARGRRLSIQFEAGMEVPPHLDTRMGIHWDWQTWINDGIADELALKVMTPESAFIHQHLLPLARRRGIPVHLISRLLTHGFEPRAGETLPRIVTRARDAGFAGYSFYEARNILEMNPQGIADFKGPTEWAIRAANQALRR